MSNDIYIIDEQIRQALIAIIGKGVHPNIAFDQVSAIRQHLEELKPVQMIQGPTAQEGAEAHLRNGHAGPDDNGCGYPSKQPLEETAPV